MGPVGIFAVHSTFSGYGYLAFEVFVYFSLWLGMGRTEGMIGLIFDPGILRIHNSSGQKGRDNLEGRHSSTFSFTGITVGKENTSAIAGNNGKINRENPDFSIFFIKNIPYRTGSAIGDHRMI